MTITLFMALLVILAVAVSLFTEAVKKYLDETKTKYSSNIVVLILSVIVGAGGTALMYLLLVSGGMPGIPKAASNSSFKIGNAFSMSILYGASLAWESANE